MSEMHHDRGLSVAEAVGSHVAQLQAQLQAEVPAARARLASLRSGVGRQAGDVPAIWAETVEIVPEALQGHTDEPNHAEWAVHVAMTSYSLHQRPTGIGAHRPGVGFGEAVGHLARVGRFSEEAVRRRFLALVTSQSPEEAARHLQGLISQLRVVEIGLDYGRLAEDLRRLFHPTSAKRVRLAWGRQYHHVPSEQTEEK